MRATNKNLLFTSLLFVFFCCISSCRKPDGGDECAFKKETISMNVGLAKLNNPNSFGEFVHLDSLAICKYDLMLIGLYFNTKYLPYEMCSTPHDSIVGTIENIFVINKQNYNHIYKANDTINNIISLIFKDEGWFTKTPISLNDFLKTKPNCTQDIRLFITQAPDSTVIQSFEIIYKETDGTTFSLLTKPIFITP